MSKFMHEKTPAKSVTVLAGPEIETLADYFGQGSLEVCYFIVSTGRMAFHPLTHAYDNIIAQCQDTMNPLCMSTDSNRSEEGNLFPKRTSIEFRSGPKSHHTKDLLRLVKVYSDWLTRQKSELREREFIDYKHPTRVEANKSYYLNLSDFIEYYNAQVPTLPLCLTSPQSVFDSKIAGPDFTFRFPEDAQWVLKLSYVDLASKYTPVFTTQYNMSIPIGCVFDPKVKQAFPIATQFPLLKHEKEVAADFNESRPHLRLTAYEQETFAAAVALADRLFRSCSFPSAAMGAQDFLRGMAYEIAMISTSQAYLAELFQDDALWIAQQHKKAEGVDKKPTDRDIKEISFSLANTVRKSIFPYFMKTTLAVFFTQLHEKEQQLLRTISKSDIKIFCQQAIHIANGGMGNTAEHPGHLMFKYDSFMELFDDFYEQTFKGAPVKPEHCPADPIACLTDRFIPIANLGTKKDPINAVVVELRNPAQGQQGYADIQVLCTRFKEIQQSILTPFFTARRHSLNTLQACKAKPVQLRPVLQDSSKAPKRVVAAHTEALFLESVFHIQEIPADGHCLYHSLIQGLLVYYPRAYQSYSTYADMIRLLRKQISHSFQSDPEQYNHLIIDEEQDRRTAERACEPFISQQIEIQRYIAEQRSGTRIHRKTEEEMVHWGSGPELLAVRNLWSVSYPKLEIVIIQRHADGRLYLDQDPRELHGKTLLCLLFEPHRQHYSLLNIQNPSQLMPFLLQVPQNLRSAAADAASAKAPKATPVVAHLLTQAAPETLVKSSAKIRRQLKRQTTEAEEEVASPPRRRTPRFFTDPREKTVAEESHDRYIKTRRPFPSHV